MFLFHTSIFERHSREHFQFLFMLVNVLKDSYPEQNIINKTIYNEKEFHHSLTLALSSFNG
jgi:hypothetical protein